MIEAGSTIAQRFLVERSLGAGGMGEVLLVRHVGLGERFALKVLRRPDPTDSRAIARFEREARAAAGLRCEHAVRVTDFGRLDDGSPFFVMEYIDGSSLATRLRRDGPMAPSDAVRAVLHACAALAEAHALGIIHRDIKPANLLLTSRSDGSPLVKLADFGIAKLLLGAGSLTETQAALGSPAYMPPEQIRDARGADIRSDVWSLGVTLFELLAGQTPFHAFTAPGILSRVLTEEPTPLSSLCPSLPGGLAPIVARCLEKDPARRFPSVLELADALAPFAPEPGEGARVRRISAFARRSPPEPSLPGPTPAAVGLTTDAPTSLTQAPEISPPSLAAPALTPAPVPSARAPRRPWPLVAGVALVSVLAWQGVARWSSPGATSSGVASAASAAASAPEPPAAPASVPPAASLPAVVLVAPPAAAAATTAAAAAAAAATAAAPAASARPAPKRPAAPAVPAVPAVRGPSLGEFGSRQ